MLCMPADAEEDADVLQNAFHAAYEQTKPEALRVPGLQEFAAVCVYHHSCFVAVFRNFCVSWWAPVLLQPAIKLSRMFLNSRHPSSCKCVQEHQQGEHFLSLNRGLMGKKYASWLPTRNCKLIWPSLLHHFESLHTIAHVTQTPDTGHAWKRMLVP
eukprot:1158620-Pelagomonas_calceolata.AAC.7